MPWLDYRRSRGGVPPMHRPYRHGFWDLPESQRQLILATVGAGCVMLVVILFCVIVIVFGDDAAVPPGLRAARQAIGRFF